MESNRSKIWSDAEKDTLREMRARHVPVPQIAEQLGRPVSSVYAQARIIGTRVMARAEWTPEEDAVLAKAVREGAYDREIAKQLDRSVSSVRWRMTHLAVNAERSVHIAARRKRDRETRATKAPKAASKTASKKAPRKMVSRARPGPSEEVIAQVVDLSAARTAREVSELTGLSHWQVKEIGRKRGVKFVDAGAARRKVERDELERLWEAGWSRETIAEKLGRALSWVNTMSIKLGLREPAPKRGRHVGTQIDIDELRDIAGRMTITQVARHYTKDPRTLRRIAKEHGITFKAPTRSKPRSVSSATGAKQASAQRLAQTVERREAAKRPCETAKRHDKAPSTRSRPKLSAAQMAERRRLIREIAIRMRAEGRLPA